VLLETLGNESLMAAATVAEHVKIPRANAATRLQRRHRQRRLRPVLDVELRIEVLR